MTGETLTILLVNKRLAVAIAALTLGLVGCAKTDVQAPAKEAPSAAASVAPQAEAEAVPQPPPSPASADRWPAAEEKANLPTPGAGAGIAPKSEPAPVLAPAQRDKSDDAKKKETARPRAAAKPAKSELGGEGRSGAADEAEPALAVTESWTQLNVAYDELTSALALSVPDCSAAERFRHNVCALAEHICTLERELPSTTPHNCGDGRTRCSEATIRYNAKCER
jgi:hypothetical protein